MSQPFADRIGESFTTTGTGAITLTGARAGGFKTVASRFSDGEVRTFLLYDPATGDWETSNCTISSSGTVLTRTTVQASSNSDNAVSFGAGTKQATQVASAAHFNSMPRGNLLINGGPDVWQAGTSFSPTAGTRMRCADTWWAKRPTSANFTVTRQTGVNNRHCIRVQRTNGTTDTHVISLCVSLETQDAAWMATALPSMVFSFYARAGANYSNASGNLVCKVIRGTGTDENQLDGYTGSSTLATLTQAITTTMTRYSIAFTPDASTNELAVEFTFTPVGTAGAADYFDIECAQPEVGSVPSAFERRPMSRQITDCGRYYQKSFPYATTPAQAWGTTDVYFMTQVFAGSGSQRSPVQKFAPRMRVAPTVTLFNPVSANAEARDVGGSVDATATGSSLISESVWSFTFTSHASATVGTRYSIHFTAADANF